MTTGIVIRGGKNISVQGVKVVGFDRAVDIKTDDQALVIDGDLEKSGRVFPETSKKPSPT